MQRQGAHVPAVKMLINLQDIDIFLTSAIERPVNRGHDVARDLDDRAINIDHGPDLGLAWVLSVALVRSCVSILGSSRNPLATCNLTIGRHLWQ